MNDAGPGWFLRLLRLPPAPGAPAGAPGSLRMFRAAPGYYRLRVASWALRQASTLAGILLAAWFLFGGITHRLRPDREPEQQLLDLQRRFDATLGPWLRLLEGFALAAWVAQLPVSFLLLRLDYRQRWYLVTDRSLRLRAGVWTVEEHTMTYANIQEISVQQGPLQRLLGIADLKVRSAGGGAAVQEGENKRETHVAWFHGVDNAPAIRDLILDHLRHLRDTGIGDADEAPAASVAGGDERLAAVRELLAAARALREAVAARPPPFQVFPPPRRP
jgi:hypothetical protein